MRRTKIYLSLVIAVGSLAAVITGYGYQFYLNYEFSVSCGGHLKRAADANTVNVAARELSYAIDYMEAKGLTEGYTSIFLPTPDEDIAFWYNNLKESHKELMQVDSTTSQLEKSNVLMKLRETLMDQNEKGAEVTMPEGIYKYPNNVFWFWYNIGFSFLFVFVLAAYGKK